MAKKRNSFKKYLVLMIFVLVIILIYFVNMLLALKEDNNKENSDINVIIDVENIVKNENQEELNRLKQMSERNRIEYYVSQFIKDVENGNFEEAYSVLNNDFKKNYFSTIKDFKEYSEKKFTKMVDVDYTNFERNGTIYIIWLTLTDAINGDKDSGQEMNFVVKENDFNDFELSFSVN